MDKCETCGAKLVKHCSGKKCDWKKCSDEAECGSWGKPRERWCSDALFRKKPEVEGNA